MSVLSLLLLLPVCYADRAIDVPIKRAQLATIATAIELATDRQEEQAALITIGWFESRFCLSVHSGAKRGGRGAGLWQIEPGSHRSGPFAGLDADATQHAASEALWLWRHSWCGGRRAERFGAYAGLGCRSWPGPEGSAARVRFWGWATWELAKLAAI